MFWAILKAYDFTDSAERVGQARAMLDFLAQCVPDQTGAYGVLLDLLGSDILQCYGAGLVELHGMPSPFASQPGSRPQASPLARHQARRGGQVTNLRHETLNLDDKSRRFLALLARNRAFQR